MQIHRYLDSNNSILNEFNIECDHCCGLCCVALYFSKLDGFPTDKIAGIPCPNLAKNFRCSIHEELIARHMKGCIVYECYGAGQIVTELYSRKNWSSNPELSAEIFSVFIKTFKLQQILWYLFEAANLLPAIKLQVTINGYIQELQSITHSIPKVISEFDIDIFRKKANLVLKEAAKLVQKEVGHTHRVSKKKDYIGHNFKRTNLDGYDFTSSYLIAANLEGCSLIGSNFLGADLRDVNIKNTDLSESIFLIQGQLNSAKGNKYTRIPSTIIRPHSWE